MTDDAERPLVSPTEAMQAKLAEEPDPRGHPCSECGRWPVGWFEFHSIVATSPFLAGSHRGMWSPSDDKEVVRWWVCRNCAIKVGLKAQGGNLLFGWWSPPAFVMNLVALARNSRQLIRSFSLGPPSTDPPKG